MDPLGIFKLINLQKLISALVIILTFLILVINDNIQTVNSNYARKHSKTKELQRSAETLPQ
jgi:hypothetical protein